MSENEFEFEKIYAAFQPKILRYLTRLIGETEAEDVAQEVFVRIDQSLKDFRGGCQLSTWIYRVATNAAIDKMRSLPFRRSSEECLLDDSNEVKDKEAWAEKESLSPEGQLMRKERVECFINYVEDLPMNYRTVVVLGELEEMTNNEIAEILGLSLATVKVRLHRGRTRLLQELRTHCKAEDWL